MLISLTEAKRRRREVTQQVAKPKTLADLLHNLWVNLIYLSQAFIHIVYFLQTEKYRERAATVVQQLHPAPFTFTAL
jgi:hypothetical protein